MNLRLGFLGKVLAFSLLGVLCLGVWPVDAASDLVIMDAGKVVTVNTSCADLEVSFPNGWATGQWGGVPVSLEVVATEDLAAMELPAFPEECGDFAVLRFRNLVTKPDKVGETKVYPKSAFFEGLGSSQLYCLVSLDGEEPSWQHVAGWPPETTEEPWWSFRFDGAGEVVFLLCGVEEPVVPDTFLSGTDWQLFWTVNGENWLENDEPMLTFAEGPEEDPGAVYFTLSSTGEWDSIGSLDLYLYFETDPSAGLCLFHRVGSDGEWLSWDLSGLVEVRPDEAEGWLEGYGFRVHMIFPNEMITNLGSLNDIRFRLGSCVVPGVASGDFDGEAPYWKLVYRACSDDQDASVSLVPYSLNAGDLDGLGENERAVLEGVIDSLFFNLLETGCIEALEVSFWFECGTLQEGERYYLWAIDAEGEEVVLTPLPDDLTGWGVLDEPLLEGDRAFCYRLWADLSGYTFDGDTLFVLAPLSPEDLEPGGVPGGDDNDDGSGSGGGCSIGGISPLFLLLVPLGMLSRR